jgi:hypothetical protein
LVGVVTGGWGEKDSFMEYTNRRSKEKGLLVGSVILEVAGQAHYGDVDFEQRYPGLNLPTRQELMLNAVEAEIYVPGGVGTLYEYFKTLTHSKVGVGTQKPIILLGNAKRNKEWVEELVKDGFAPSNILDNIYCVDDGKKVYDILCKHFKTFR